MKKRTGSIPKKLGALIASVLIVGLAFAYIGWGDRLGGLAEKLGIEYSRLTDLYVRELGDDELELHFIDVGQGDAILLRSNRAAILIDAGTNSSEALLKGYLRSFGVYVIDCFVCTHPHDDHIGGADMILNSFKVGRVLLCDSDSTSYALTGLLDKAKLRGVELVTPEYGAVYTVGDISFRVLAPSAGADTAQNNGSIVVRAEWGETSFLLTGDAERDSEAAMLADFTPEELKSTLLKLGHHGSNTSTSDEFLATVSPEWAVITCGRDNEYGHPHREVLNRLGEYGVPANHILRTDKNGSIVFISDGSGLYLYGEKDEADKYEAEKPAA